MDQHLISTAKWQEEQKNVVGCTIALCCWTAAFASRIRLLVAGRAQDAIPAAARLTCLPSSCPPFQMIVVDLNRTLLRRIGCFRGNLRAHVHTSVNNLRIVFFGNDHFSLASLKPLHQKCEPRCDLIQHLHVVSVRHSLVSQFARSHQIPLTAWPIETLPESYDVGIVVSFGHLIPEKMIRSCRMGMLNVHASLLPRWRGASPIHQAVLAGDRITGVTVMLIAPDRFDVGDIVCQAEYEMPDRATTTQVHKDLAQLGGDLLMQTILRLPHSLQEARPQAREGVTRAPKPKKDHGFIRFDEMISCDVDRRCRALDGLVDITTEWVDGSTIKLSDVSDPQALNARPLDDLIGDVCAPGSIVYHKPRKLLCFKCKDNRWIGFASATMHGKGNMTALQFFNGYMSRLLKQDPPPSKIKQIKKTRYPD